MESIYTGLGLFFVYSAFGWLAECILAAVRKRRFVNRGVLSGPICCIYGFAALVITFGFSELKGSLPFLFLFSALFAGLIEWLCGHFLERIYHKKWWDYSMRRFQIDGYVCLQSALLWGVLGVLGIYFVNPTLRSLLTIAPQSALHVILWVLLGMTILDAIGSYVVLLHLPHAHSLDQINEGLSTVSRSLNRKVRGYVQGRMKKAYPVLAEELRRPEKTKSKVFAEGCGCYKLFLLFMIGAFLGDIVETIFCRVTTGLWMSRSSVVWGPLSIVWGLAIGLATLLLYNHRTRSDGFLFLFGALLGGAYEYLCSVFTELVFGKVFWDYSWLPFNLGGRINLLYCFFWGIAAVLWLKRLYPHLSDWIERIPICLGKVMTWCLLAFMLCNIAMSSLALVRSELREAGLPAESTWEVWMDEHYGDEVLRRIYPNSISRNG